MPGVVLIHKAEEVHKLTDPLSHCAHIHAHVCSYTDTHVSMHTHSLPSSSSGPGPGAHLSSLSVTLTRAPLCSSCEQIAAWPPKDAIISGVRPSCTDCEKVFIRSQGPHIVLPNPKGEVIQSMGYMFQIEVQMDVPVFSKLELLE